MRRGRPPKVKQVESPQAEAPAIEAPKESAIGYAQSLANRIVASQSPDVPKGEVLARVKRGLSAQGFSMDGIIL